MKATLLRSVSDLSRVEKARFLVARLKNANTSPQEGLAVREILLQEISGTARGRTLALADILRGCFLADKLLGISDSLLAGIVSDPVADLSTEQFFWAREHQNPWVWGAGLLSRASKHPTDEAVFAAVHEGVQSDVPERRAIGVWVAGNILSVSPGSYGLFLSSVLKAYQDPEPMVRALAVQALGKTSRVTEQGLLAPDVIGAALSDHSQEVRLAALVAFARTWVRGNDFGFAVTYQPQLVKVIESVADAMPALASESLRLFARAADAAATDDLLRLCSSRSALQWPACRSLRTMPLTPDQARRLQGLVPDMPAACQIDAASCLAISGHASAVQLLLDHCKAGDRLAPAALHAIARVGRRIDEARWAQLLAYAEQVDGRTAPALAQDCLIALAAAATIDRLEVIKGIVERMHVANREGMANRIIDLWKSIAARDTEAFVDVAHRITELPDFEFAEELLPSLSAALGMGTQLLPSHKVFHAIADIMESAIVQWQLEGRLIGQVAKAVQPPE